MKTELQHFKNNSDRIINDLGLMDFKYLPILQGFFEFKNEKKIKERSVALSILIQFAFKTVRGTEITEYLEGQKMTKILTSDENQFLSHPSEQGRNAYTWRSESLFVLLWSRNIVKGVDNFLELCDLNSVPKDDYPCVNIIQANSSFLNKSYTSVMPGELIQMLDLYSRLDYICDWYKINNLALPLNSALIYQRRYSLIWLSSNVHWGKVECNSIL